ncbi:MAG: hypothetical protein ACOCSR_05495 [Wenzhouxiangella sp.]
MLRLLAMAIVPAFVAACATTTTDCSPRAGFSAALSGERSEPACREDDYGRAYRLGHTLSEMRAERDALRAEIDELDDDSGRKAARLRARLRVLERDIPEIEALARLDGLMAPATIEPE